MTPLHDKAAAAYLSICKERRSTKRSQALPVKLFRTKVLLIFLRCTMCRLALEVAKKTLWAQQVKALDVLFNFKNPHSTSQFLSLDSWDLTPSCDL